MSAGTARTRTRRCGGDETAGESIHNTAAILKVGGGGGCAGPV